MNMKNIISGLIAILLLVCITSSTVFAVETTQIKIDVMPDEATLPYYVAAEEGIITDYGLDEEVVPFQSVMVENRLVKTLFKWLVFAFWFTLAGLYLALFFKVRRWYKKVKRVGGVTIGESSLGESSLSVGGLEMRSDFQMEGIVSTGISNESNERLDLAEFLREISKTDMNGFILASLAALFTGIAIVFL